MKENRLVSCRSLFALLVLCGVTAVHAAPEGRESLHGYSDLVRSALPAWEVPGVAIVIVKDGETVLMEGIGLRDLEQKLPVTPRTLFAIGSSTKAFTTYTTATLVDEGKLQWDQPVARFLPGFRLYDPIATQLITPRDLVTHRSGLPRHDALWYGKEISLSRREFVQRLQYLEPNEVLRAKFQYNNAMYVTAGYLIENLTGQTWEQAVKSRVFEPLGMAHSNFSVRESQKSDDFSYPYARRDEKVQKVPFREIDLVGPAGSINSSIEDMAQWVKVHLNEGRAGDRQLLAQGLLNDLHTAQMTTRASPERPEILPAGYALGWFVDTYRGHLRVSHGGNIDGFTALVSLFPQDKLGMVVLANLSGTRLPEMLVRHAADRILGLPPIDWNSEEVAKLKAFQVAEKQAKQKKETVRKRDTKPAHTLAEYAGDYEHPGYGSLKMELKGGRLAATYNNISAPLDHWHYEVFNALKDEKDPALEDTKFKFETDVRGNVAAVSVPFEPQVKDIVFIRKPDAKFFDPTQLRQFTGQYELAGRTMTIGLEGSTLTAQIPGTPVYHFVPVLGGEFVFKENSEHTVRFDTDQSGRVTALLWMRPDGVFTAKRKN